MTALKTQIQKRRERSLYLHWSERAQILLEIHEAKVSANPKWTIQKTADLLRVTRSTAIRDIALARAVAKERQENNGVSELCKITDLNKAVQVLIVRRTNARNTSMMNLLESGEE